MRILWLTPLVLAGCGPELQVPSETGNPDLDTAIEDTAPQPEGFPSSFTRGKYRFTTLSIAEDTEGIDITGDGTPENNLPNALKLIDLALSDLDLSRENLNTLMMQAIVSDNLIYLLNAVHNDGEMISDWLPGQIDAVSLTAEPSPAAYNSSGYPKSRMRGLFQTETDFRAGPGSFELYLVFPAPYPTFSLPLEIAHVQANVGVLNDDGVLSSAGTIGGAVPVDTLINDVIDPLIPEEGVDTNNDGQVDLTKEAIMNTVNALGANENVADIDLGDDRRGISAALKYEAEATDW